MDEVEDEEEEVEETTPVKTSEGPMSKADMEKRVTSLLDEYLASNDEDEASLSFKEMDCAALHGDAVVAMIMHVMEKKEVQREKVDKLLVHLAKGKVIEQQGFLAGLTEVMGVVDELSMDVPKFGHYVARSIGLLAAADAVLPESIKALLSPVEGAPLMAKIYALVVHTIQEVGGEAKAKEFYAACAVPFLTAMMDGDQTADAAKDLLEGSALKCGDVCWMIEG